jgi:acetyl-CoA decarbonylase/synthase complex subunit gamma
LTAETIVEAFKQSGIEQKINHKYLIIPGLAARLRGEIEEEIGDEWQVLVGPKDSSGIAEYLEKWPPKEI